MVCVYYISQRVMESSLHSSRWMQWIDDARYLQALFAVLLLLPLNWFLEIVKWERCVSPIKPVSRSFATSAVLRGLALNWVLPFTLGDFMGRLLGLPKDVRSMKAILVSRAYAIGTTGLVGLAGLAFLYDERLWWVFVGLLIPAALFLWHHQSRGERLYSLIDHGAILSLTVGRYVVFYVQLLLLLYIVLPDVPLPVIFSGIGVVFLIRSAVPSLLGALGVREAAIVFVFSPYVSDVTPLLLASFSLWVINIILPSLVGIWPVLAFRIKISL